MANWLLVPPIAFIVVLLLSMLLSKVSKALEFHDNSAPGGKYKSYACGENVDSPRVQPGYEQFFPFAFFFTILHVAALTITTVPVGTAGTYTMAVIYIVGVVIGLVVLFRK